VKPIKNNTKTPQTATGLFALLGALLCIAGSGASAVLPAAASAYATLEGPPIFSSASGLPDGRVYEQVSPADKHGNEAGAGLDQEAEGPGTGQERYALAAPDGNSVLFEGTGPMGETAAAYDLFFVASKNVSGSECPDSGGSPGSRWCTRSVMPTAQQSAGEIGGTVGAAPSYLDPSSDLSHVIFTQRHSTWALDMPNFEECGFQTYLSGSDPFVAATWLDRPEIPNPVVRCPAAYGPPVGGTPDFSTVYFNAPGPLLGEDAARTEGGGFYEDSEGTLREAGVLPGGGLSPFGASAATSMNEGNEGNRVSANGLRAFFVSPEPGSCTTNGGQNNCTVDPPELYVRETEGEGSEADHKTVLVSQDTLLPDVGGLPAPAPADPEGSAASFAFASADGSQAFFQSEDRLTSAAPEGPPGDTSVKTYDFDLDTGVLTYLPNVVGRIVATDTEGTSFAFVRPEAGGEPAELDLWTGPEAGHVTPVTELPGPPSSNYIDQYSELKYVSEARMSSDGSVLAFVTNTALPGAFNSGPHTEPAIPNEQIYRYDAPANTLGCVSCPPHGVTPTGSATMDSAAPSYSQKMVESRGMSDDGDRIFFDTPDPLVPQAANSGSTDVYAWENGVVYLISSGKSTHNSYFLDNSANGDDVFFATTDGLVPGDTDGAYDVYDARVPQPGDNPPPAAVPCEGSVCQGPPSVASPLAAPARATFAGSDNLVPEPIPAATVTKKTTTKTTRCRKGFVKKKTKCVKKPKAKKSAKGRK
jgi:hypothetical protein